MTISRRDFMKSTGVLIVSFGAQGLLHGSALAQGPFGTHPSHIDPKQLDSWIAVSADGTVTAFTGKCDLGQGMQTVQTQLVAEELCVPLRSVKVIACDTAVCPDQGTTSGSQSTPTNFNNEGLAQAAATAREALVQMAARQLGADANALEVMDGVITAPGGKRVTYQDLVGGKHFEIAVNQAARRRAPSQWRVLGKAVPSLDRAALMTGRFEFVQNVRVPGMLHGRVVRPPEVGATVASVHESSVRGIAGNVQVVRVRDFVGVVAEKPWQAMEAARKLKVSWNKGTGLPPQKTFFESLRAKSGRDQMLVDSKDTEQKLGSAAKVVKATYVYPYQMHGSVGTSCAVADVKPGAATVWSATQSVYPTRSIVAKILNVPLEQVHVIFVRGSGCYGLNGADAVSFDAALLSHGVGKPVRVQLSREDEMAWENFGSACVVDQRAGIDALGGIAAWECEVWAASRGNRPGYDKPGNVVTGFLAGFEPEIPGPQAASEPTKELRNRSNEVPSYVAGCVGKKCAGMGNVRSERVLTHTVESPFFTGPLRSPLRIQNTFAHECFMDELAEAAGVDPVEFRLRHLRNQRLIDVLQAAAKAAKWEPQSKPARNGTGRGVACVAYEGDNGYAALIADVRVNAKSGAVLPVRFTIAVDSGPISNPDGLRNQTEGGILQGMSRSLVEEVTWDERRVTSVDWVGYPSLPLGIEVPEVEVVLIDQSDVPATGAGETAITLVPAAIGNAIFDATGIRLRAVPFTADRLKAARTQGAAA